MLSSAMKSTRGLRQSFELTTLISPLVAIYPGREIQSPNYTVCSEELLLVPFAPSSVETVSNECLRTASCWEIVDLTQSSSWKTKSGARSSVSQKGRKVPSKRSSNCVICGRPTPLTSWLMMTLFLVDARRCFLILIIPSLLLTFHSPATH